MDYYLVLVCVIGASMLKLILIFNQMISINNDVSLRLRASLKRIVDFLKAHCRF